MESACCFIVGNLSASPGGKRSNPISRTWKQELVGFGELDVILQFWKPNQLHICQISQHLLCASVSADGCALLCSGSSSSRLSVLCHHGTGLLRASGHHSPFSCGQVCGIPGRPPLGGAMGVERSEPGAHLLRRGLGEQWRHDCGENSYNLYYSCHVGSNILPNSAYLGTRQTASRHIYMFP